MYPELNGKVVIVTGAGRPRGIGRQTAARFAAEGASVVVVDLADDSTGVETEVLGIPPDLGATVASIRAAGGTCEAMPADVSDSTQVNALLDRVIERFGRLDAMVCNAAVTHDHGMSVENLDADTFNRVLSVNITGTFLCAQAAAARMIESGVHGSIITIGSRASRRGNPNIIAYSASKFGVLGLSQSLALALAGAGIRVNCVCPGAVDTDMADAEFAIAQEQTGEPVAALRERAASAVPLGRLTTAEDLSNCIVWLASDQSAHMTGQAINVNGGTWLS